MCTLLSRTTNTTTNTSHLEEREGELELQRLEKKDEPGEAASERCAGVFLFFSFSLNQVLSCCVQNHLFSFSMCVNVTWVYFAGVGRQSPWTAAAATAQRSLLPAQRGCVQRASASPPEGAVNRPPANSPR